MKNIMIETNMSLYQVPWKPGTIKDTARILLIFQSMFGAVIC